MKLRFPCPPRALRRCVISACVLFAAAWIGIDLAIDRAPLPAARDAPPPATPVLVDMRDRPFARPGSATIRDATPIALREMGRWLPLATVAIEDHRFWNHPGVDWHATAGAALRNLRNLRVVSGASTITQQTVKILTGRSNRTFAIKAREALCALKLDRVWTKEKILETYLNRLDYGNRRIGAEAAAQAYFGKPASGLSLAEAIFLAGIPQSPTRLNPWRNPSAALARYHLNVQRLAKAGLLPAGIDAASLLAAPPKVSRHFPPVLAPHFTELALARSSARTGVIRTTLDLDLQRVAESILREHLRVGSRLGIGDAAIVVVDNATGEVRALASAGRAEHGAINAAAVPRSSGSTLKPFIYLSAIDKRLITAATLLPDTPQAITAEYRDYDPQNYSHRSCGPVRAREALGNSLNVPAVCVVAKLGARTAFDELRRWGFAFPGSFDDYGAGFILGNAGVRLIDLAGAYAGLARGGLAWPARLLRNEPIESRRIASPEASAIVTDILCDNEARRLSFGANSPLDLGVRAAVKTGTSSGFRDRWCAGFTGSHTVAVWAGNLDGKSLGEVLAVRAAGPLWAGMMRHLLDHGDHPLPVPAASRKLLALDVAAETGLLPRPSDRLIHEWFLPSTAPAENAASMYAMVDGRQRLILPPEYAAWCASPQNRLAAIARSPDLEIIFPRDGATFIFNPHLPARQQTLTPLSTAPACAWTLNGRPLTDPSIPLSPGNWTLTATAAGKQSTATFTVE